MFLPQKGTETLRFLFIGILMTGLFGCAAVSPIQNIRQPDSADAIDKDSNLIFMTFNIRAGGGITNPKASPFQVKATKENLLEIVETIKSVNSDIIGLQEVRGYDQAKFIAEKLNFNFVYIAHGYGPSSRRWGLALLSKFKISEVKTTSLSQGSYRRILICSIPIGEKIVSVINVHISLSHRAYDDTTYEAQFHTIEKVLDSTEGPIVLMGDLNRNPTDPELKPIQEKLLDTCLAINPEEHCWVRDRGTFTFPPGRHMWIDYIFINSKFFEVKKVGLVPKNHWDASDHKALFSEVILKDFLAD